MRKTLATLTIASCLLLLGGCDSSEPDTILPDSFAPGQGGISVSGGLTSSFNGVAFWSVIEEDEDLDGPMFILLIINGSIEDLENEQYEAVLVGGEGVRPGLGTYPLRDFAGDGEEGVYDGIYVRSQAQNFVFVTSESGSMVITGSSAQRLEGTLSFTGAAFSFAGPLGSEATISGGFNAMFIDPSDVPDDAGAREKIAARIVSEFIQ